MSKLKGLQKVLQKWTKLKAMIILKIMAQAVRNKNQMPWMR